MESEDRCKVTPLHAGQCIALERFVVGGGRYQHVRIPSMFFVIQHSSGYLLYDCGYAPRFYNETNQFPGKFYAWLTPVEVSEDDSAKSKVQNLGISPEQITHIFISHFHADHVGGLIDFPNAKFVYLKEGYGAVCQHEGFRAVSHGYLRGLIPQDFEERSIPLSINEGVSSFGSLIKLEENMKPFTEAIDFFGDRKILLIPLPGHCPGHMGLLVRTYDEVQESEKDFFFVGDACWHSNTINHLQMPHWLTRVLIHEDWAKYKQTIQNLHELHKNNTNVVIFPAHCPDKWNMYINKPKATSNDHIEKSKL